MSPWAPWLLALVVWNAAFDLQVRRAAERFTVEQVVRWELGRPPALLRDAFTPQVHTAASRASGLTGLVLVASLAWRQRAARASHR